MGKTIIDLISNVYSITGNSQVDTVLFAVAGIIAFCIAFNIVGIIFDALRYYDSYIMSNTHWTIRIIAFGLLTWIFKQIFRLVNWICSFQWWIYLLIVILIIFLVVILSIIKHRRSIRNYCNLKQPANLVEAGKGSTPLTGDSVIANNINIIKSKRDTCPRCGHVLVKRYGPYGGFWGCGGFPNCRYTRSFH